MPTDSTANKVPKTLAQVLVDEGSIAPEQMREALDIQMKEGGFLGQILIDKGCFDEKSLTSFLVKLCKIPHLNLLDYLLDGDLFDYIPKEVCFDLHVMPIDKLGRNLTVAMVDPLDMNARERIRDLCPELRIKPILCAYSHYKKVMEKLLRAEETQFGSPPEMDPAGHKLFSPETSKPAPEMNEPNREEPSAAAAGPASIGPIAEEALPGEAVRNAPVSAQIEEAALTAKAPVTVQEPVSSLREAGADHPADPMERTIGVLRDNMRYIYAVLARRTKLFRGLSSEEVAEILASGTTSEHDAGETILDEGGKSGELHFVLSGKVDVIDEGRAATPIEAGGLLSEMARIGDEPRKASAVAVEATSLITMSKTSIEHLRKATGDPSLSGAILDKLIRNARSIVLKEGPL